jgi:hypothetical protein
MTIEEALVAHLRWYDAEIASLVGQTNIFPGVIPEEITAPALAYDVTAQEHGMSHSGPTGLVVSTIAIYCLSRGAETYATAKGIAEKVLAAVEYPTYTWGDVQVARKHATVSGGVWNQDTQDWMVTVTVTVNHMG